jgi:hypothetical protein
MALATHTRPLTLTVTPGEPAVTDPCRFRITSSPLKQLATIVGG